MFKKVILSFLLVLSITLVSFVKLNALDYNVGTNDYYSYLWTDEFTIYDYTTNYANFTKDNTYHDHYVISFKEDTPALEESGIFIVIGNYITNIASVTYSTDQIFFSRIDGENNDLTNDFVFVSDDTVLDNQTHIGIYMDGTSDVKTFMETYAIITYQTAEQYIKNGVNYYKQIARGEGYDEGYLDGLADGDGGTYAAGYIDGKNDGLAEGYDTAYEDGQDDMYNNGSTANGYIVDDSYDYIRGLNVGSATNVNAGVTNFLSGLENWIVPAIVLVILLGGFTTIMALKRKNGGD